MALASRLEPAGGARGVAAAGAEPLRDELLSAERLDKRARSLAARFTVAPPGRAARSVLPRAGWTWYTGSAGWLHRAGLESMLGLRRHGDTFELDPCIPGAWPGYGITWRFGRTRYQIAVENPGRRCRGIATALLDGAAVDPAAVPLSDDGLEHHLQVVMGEGQGEREGADVTARAGVEAAPSG